MIPLISTPTAQATLSNLATVSPPPTQPVISAAGNLTPIAIAANGGPEALFNNLKGASNIASHQRGASKPTSTTGDTQINRTSRRISIVPEGQSSTFVAQAMGQTNPANDNRPFLAFDEAVLPASSSSTVISGTENLLDSSARFILTRGAQDQSLIVSVGANAYENSAARGALLSVKSIFQPALNA